MQKIAENVEFNTIAREWRCKWSPNNNKESLVEAQRALEQILDRVKAVDGVERVDRVVCGGCHDFKVVISLSTKKFEFWEKVSFQPEEEFLAKLRSINGITHVETQTYTLMRM